MDEFDAIAVLDQMTQMLEIAAGYRTRAVDMGFSEAAADELAVVFHEVLMRKAVEL